MEDLKNCDFIKTILMLCVVIYHCMYFWTGSWFTACEPIDESSLLVYLSGWLKTFHVPAFTLTSGYIYYYVRFERKGYDSFGKFVLTKCRRLLVPYIFVLLVWVIPFAIYYYDLELIILLKKYLLGTGPAQLWFLLMLFGVFLIARTLDVCFRNNFFLSICIIAVLFLVGQIANKFDINYFQIANACSYLPYFWMGFVIRQYYSNISNTSLCVAGLLCLGINLGTFIFSMVMSGSIQNLILKTSSVPGALMAFFLLLLIARSVSWNSKCFKFFQKSSFSVYLFHQQFIFIVIWITNGIINPYMIAFMSFVVSMIGSLLITSFIRRFAILKPLIGEKV